MQKAAYQDKELVVNILTRSFANNKSVNYIAKKSISSLMDYSFEICWLFGEILLSENKKACALILYPDQQKTTLKTILLDAKLMLQCIGLSNLKKVLDRETKIKQIKPDTKMTYLWFIGVEPDFQQTGIGSKLLNTIISQSKEAERPVYLETSTLQTLPWYQQFGFRIYGELDLGFIMYFLRTDAAKD